MTYFKCTSCKARLYTEATPDGLVRDLCPECGSMLDPVGELGEVVGYRSIELRGDSAPHDAPRTRHGAIIHRFDELQATRGARAARASIDSDRWLDDGGAFDAATVLPGD